MKKKILITSSIGGGGHVSVTAALKESLESDYNITVATMLEEILAPVDWIQQISSGRSSGERFYNYCLKKRAYRLINISDFVAYYFFKWHTKKIKKLIEQYIDKTKPDIIISVAPCFNGYLADVTTKKHVPLLIIPTDLDATTFIQGIKNLNNPLLHVALSFQDPQIGAYAKSNLISNAVISGFPIKSSFFFIHDKDQIKKNFSIPNDKPIILILMGAQGSESSFTFAKELTRVKQEAHFIFCLGKNEHIKSKIESLVFPKHLSYTTVGFTQNIPDLMSISQAIITKSGSVSVCEALYMNLPIILDATSQPLKWEQFNHRFITERGFGYSLTCLNDLSPLLDQLIVNNTLDTIRESITRYEKKRGVTEIKQLIAQL